MTRRMPISNSVTEDIKYLSDMFDTRNMLALLEILTQDRRSSMVNWWSSPAGSRISISCNKGWDFQTRTQSIWAWKSRHKWWRLSGHLLAKSAGAGKFAGHCAQAFHVISYGQTVLRVRFPMCSLEAENAPASSKCEQGW